MKRNPCTGKYVKTESLLEKCSEYINEVKAYIRDIDNDYCKNTDESIRVVCSNGKCKYIGESAGKEEISNRKNGVYSDPITIAKKTTTKRKIQFGETKEIPESIINRSDAFGEIIFELFDPFNKKFILSNTQEGKNLLGDPQAIGESLNCVENKNLFEHQIRVIRHMMMNRGLIVCHPTGSGKTITSIGTAYCLSRLHPRMNIIIISSSTLQENYLKEIDNFFKGDTKLVKEFLKRVYFKSYQSIEYASREVSRKGLIDTTNSFIIVDEAHNLRTEIVYETDGESPEYNITKGATPLAMNFLIKNAFKVLLLTATPLYNSGALDLYNIFSMVYGIDFYVPDELSSNGTKGKKKLSSYNGNVIKNSDKFYNYFFNCKTSFYNIPESVLNNFPSFNINEVFIPMTMEYYKYYNLVETAEKHWLEVKEQRKQNDELFVWDPFGYKYFYNALRRSNNSIIIDIQKSFPDQYLSLSPKIEWVKNFISKRKTEQTIIFTEYIDTGIFALKQVISKITSSYSLMYGDINIGIRQSIVNSFNNKLVNILIVSTKVGGEGLDLKGVKNIIILDAYWNESRNQQLIGRGVRYKSHENEIDRIVQVYKLYLIKPEEERFVDLLKTQICLPKELKKITKVQSNDLAQRVLSVDLYLRNTSLIKKRIDNSILYQLKKRSIEFYDCDYYISFEPSDPYYMHNDFVLYASPSSEFLSYIKNLDYPSILYWSFITDDNILHYIVLDINRLSAMVYTLDNSILPSSNKISDITDNFVYINHSDAISLIVKLFELGSYEVIKNTPMNVHALVDNNDYNLLMIYINHIFKKNKVIKYQEYKCSIPNQWNRWVLYNHAKNDDNDDHYISYLMLDILPSTTIEISVFYYSYLSQTDFYKNLFKPSDLTEKFSSPYEETEMDLYKFKIKNFTTDTLITILNKLVSATTDKEIISLGYLIHPIVESKVLISTSNNLNYYSIEEELLSDEPEDFEYKKNYVPSESLEGSLVPKGSMMHV